MDNTAQYASSQEVRFDSSHIERLASLARLRIAASEYERYGRELEGILAYIDGLKEADATDIEPVHHVLGLTNVLRADDERILRDEKKAATLVAVAPESENGFVRVPRVLYHE